VTRVTWAPQAIQDVEAIRAHIARDSAHYADLAVERIVAAVERLNDNPRSGRVVPELGDESLREVIHGNYRIVYRPPTRRRRDRDRVSWCPSFPTRLTVMTLQRRTFR
jgi:toxin ParE1/3/4